MPYIGLSFSLFTSNIMKGHFNMVHIQQRSVWTSGESHSGKWFLPCNQFEKPFVWRNNQDWNLWNFKLCVPFLIKGHEWIQRLFVGESALPCHGLREVAQISNNDYIIIFYNLIPFILTHIIASTEDLLLLIMSSKVKSPCGPLWDPFTRRLIVKCVRFHTQGI